MTPQRGKQTVETAVKLIHRDLMSEFNYALVWGASCKHCPQVCGKDHEMADEDVLQLMKKM